MDIKSKLGNVSFGGNWSEELLTLNEICAMLDIIDLAAEECVERDVNGDELEVAMQFTYAQVEKGPMLVEALRKALSIREPGLRQEEAMRIADYIRRFSGAG